jgi:23S rRNA (adenine2503-C2)-methyltransferase
MTDLGVDLRTRLGEVWDTRALEIAGLDRSRDGTLKAILRARDGVEVESVLIPEEDRLTLCVSTQAGCAMACTFCATGSLGFRRNLMTAEIIDQVCRMREVVETERRITNIVFMGMGEPLLNLPAVMEAVRILVHPKAFAMAPKRVTISTVGIVPKLAELLTAVPVNLAVSLHATTDAVRDRLVPINRRYPLADLLGLLRDLDSITPRRPIFFEYTLIAGMNDSEDVIDRFLRIVAGAGMRVTLRRARGEDIDAACGQLALRRLGQTLAG